MVSVGNQEMIYLEVRVELKLKKLVRLRKAFSKVEMARESDLEKLKLGRRGEVGERRLCRKSCLRN